MQINITNLETKMCSNTFNEQSITTQLERQFGKFDANGIVHVSAKDLGTNKEQSITITASSNLSEADIDKAVNEAKQFEEEDKKRKELVDTKNQGDAFIFQLEKMMKDAGDKISEEDKTKLNASIEEAKKDFASDDLETVKKALEKLQQDSQVRKEHHHERKLEEKTYQPQILDDHCRVRYRYYCLY